MPWNPPPSSLAVRTPPPIYLLSSHFLLLGLEGARTRPSDAMQQESRTSISSLIYRAEIAVNAIIVLPLYATVAVLRVRQVSGDGIEARIPGSNREEKDAATGELTFRQCLTR